MKAIKRIMSLFLAALLVSSCSNELQNDYSPNGDGNVKIVINAVWADNNVQSRTTLTETSTGITSSWKAGDRICAYSTNSSDRTYLGYLTWENGNTFSMIIPESKLSSFRGQTLDLVHWGAFTDNAIHGRGIYLEPQNSISDLAKYDLAKSTITISSDATSGTYSGVSTAEFVNLLAFIKIDFGDGKIRDTQCLHGSFWGGEISEAPPAENVSVSGVKYVPLIPGVQNICWEDSKFGYTINRFTAEAGKIYGGGKSGNQILAKTYTDRHEFVKFTYNGKTVKWATCNIGAKENATTPEDAYGLYFSWGDVTGYSLTSGHDFSWSNYIYNNGNSSLNSTAWLQWKGKVYYSDGSIISKYDAANVLWGGKWHIPSVADITHLVNATCGDGGIWDIDETSNPTPSNNPGEKGKWWTTNWNGVSGLLMMAEDDQYVFIPAAGVFRGNTNNEKGEVARFWSNKTYSYNNNLAYCQTVAFLKHHDSMFAYQNDTEDNRSGIPIRAIWGY